MANSPVYLELSDQVRSAKWIKRSNRWRRSLETAIGTLNVIQRIMVMFGGFLIDK
jgi:hypothetical protein